MLAGTKPSKVATRLSLVDWLLVVLLSTVTSVSSSTVAITDATVALVRAFICHRGHGSALDALIRTGRQFDGYFYVIGSKRLCDDGLGEGTLGIRWAMTKVTTVAKGRSTEV